MISTASLNWAAGFLEGEGSFIHLGDGGIRVCAGQVQKEPLVRLHNLFKGSLHRYKPRQKNWQRYWYWVIRSTTAISVMMTLFPLMSPRRKAQIRAALQRWKKAPGVGGFQRSKTHCPRKHSYSKRNTYIRSEGARQCKACARLRAKRRVV